MNSEMRIPFRRTLACIILTLLVGVALFAAAHAKQITLTAQPRFDDRGQFTYLLLTNVQQTYELMWAMDSEIAFVPVTLDTNRVYTFTLVEEPFREITIPRLHKVQQDGRTIYDIEVCEIHKIRMDYMLVEIYYGLIISPPTEPSPEIERKSFPHWREFSLGGCVVMKDSPKNELVYVCSDCKKAYHKWKLDNKK